MGDSNQNFLKFEDLLINFKTYDAKIEDVLLDLTFMEYELLKFFVENQENVWSREQIYWKKYGVTTILVVQEQSMYTLEDFGQN